MVYSALFNNVIEVLNLVLEKYLAEIQLPGNTTQLFSIPQSSPQSSSMACHWRDFHYVEWITNAAAVDCSWQPSIFAQTMGMASPFMFPSQCKTCVSHISIPSLGKMAIREVLWPSCLYVLYYHNPVYSMSPSRVKIREKGGVSGLESSASIILLLVFLVGCKKLDMCTIRILCIRIQLFWLFLTKIAFQIGYNCKNGILGHIYKIRFSYFWAIFCPILTLKLKS